jgi:hypothetical protein
MPFSRLQTAKNRRRILTIQDEAPTAVEAFARMFTDAHISDNGQIRGRLRAILAATRHRLVPGLHTGLAIGLTGFRPEFQDPWATSTDQVGHFLTAVRLTVDPGFLSNPLFPILLGGLGDDEFPLRIMIGHEMAPDPADVDQISLKTPFRVLRRFRAQYQSVTAEDVANFRAGKLEEIRIGTGVGNSSADLRLSYQGWLFGQRIARGGFQSKEEIADWIRTELGDSFRTGSS